MIALPDYQISNPALYTASVAEVDTRKADSYFSNIKYDNLGTGNVSKEDPVEDEKEPFLESNQHSATNTTQKIDLEDDRQLSTFPLANQREDVYLTDGAYSNYYIKYNVESFIAQVSVLLQDWLENGTGNSYSEISQIKNLLEDYSKYLEQLPETRILLGGLEFIFDDDRWSSLSGEQLKVISLQLKDFENGNVSQRSLSKFSQALWSADIV